MKVVAVALLSVSIGAVCGYLAYPSLHHVEIPESRLCHIPGATRDVVACTLSPEQMDHLSERIAPAVIQRLADSGLVTGTDAGLASRIATADANLRREQTAAFQRATEIVDQMIKDRSVTEQGRLRAQELLTQSGQADRIFEIEARISAAINRGEITLGQAGQGAPEP